MSAVTDLFTCHDAAGRFLDMAGVRALKDAPTKTDLMLKLAIMIKKVQFFCLLPPSSLPPFLFIFPFSSQRLYYVDTIHHMGQSALRSVQVVVCFSVTCMWIAVPA